MSSKKEIILWVLAAAIGVAVISYGSWSRPVKYVKNGKPIETVSPSMSVSPFSSPTAKPEATPAPTSTPMPTPTGFVGPTGLKAPASCIVGGEIEFVEKNISASREAKISWKNVDMHGRLIKWATEPEDELIVGPNLFANLTVPDGSEGLTVKLPESPKAKTYFLTAAITYGQMEKGAVVVKEVKCSGQVKIIR